MKPKGAMKATSAIVALLLCATPGAAVGETIKKVDAAGPPTPTSRVVSLLQGLPKEIAEEGKKEEDLYFAFVCWGDKVISEKTKSNAAAQARIDELEAYLDDVKSGKVEFTTEREDLEAQIAELNAKIKLLVDTRASEKKDYEAAQAEMKEAIAALEKALEVMREGTAFTQRGSLLSIRAELGESSEQHAADSTALDHAISLATRYLSNGDAVFLQRVLLGEVPKADWKKLNRKATFKAKYHARSGKIIKLLEQLLVQFKDAKAEGKAKEDQAVQIFSKLHDSLEAQLTVAMDALDAAAAEQGAKGLTLEQCDAEIEALKKQIELDTKWIAQTQGQLNDMKAEWKDRKALRAGELEAIGKAIATLHSDDARDTFRQSYESQGYLQKSKRGVLLLQTSQTSMARKGAGEVLRSAARKTGDRRLLALAMRTALEQTGHFDEVIKAIDEMVASLKAEGKDDLETKEECEKTRQKKTRESIVDAREIDELTDTISKLLAEIAEIKAKEEQLAQLHKEMDEAALNRKLEHTEYKKAKAMDEAALALIIKAKDTLENFYKDNDLVLAQRSRVPRASATPPPSAGPGATAGQAPPPPPSTWDQPYGGKTQESMGVVAVLSMLADDVEADIAKAKAEEETAVKDFEEYTKKYEESVKDLEEEITNLESTASDKAMEVEKTKNIRGDTKGSLNAVMKTYNDLAPNCDYYQTNFGVRAKNRDIEISGLYKAKGILEGAAFR